MSALTHAAETVALHYALEAFALACAYNIDKVAFFENVDSKGAAQSGHSGIRIELSQVALRGYSCLLEVTGLGAGGVLFFLLLEAYLHSLVAIGLYSLDLSNHTRTYFDNSARHILAVGTEYGCHSDFLSN